MAFVVDTAHYLPEHSVWNKDLAEFPERYRKLIEEKAGIVSRRHVTDECTSDIGAKAVKNLLDKSGMDPADIDALICATSSPDRIQPATATRIQELCGLRHAFAFDINSVCSGGVFGLKIASSLIRDGLKNVIVVAAEVYSKILNPKDIATFPYFGDGAGAVLVSDHGIYILEDFILGSDGSGADVIQIPAGGSMLPAAQVERQRDYYFFMKGSEVFDFACSKGSEVIKGLMERNKVKPDRIITHQANVNIIRRISELTELPYDHFYVNVQNCANTAGASAIIALSECLQVHRPGDRIFLSVFGGGLSWAGCYLKKSIYKDKE